MRSDSNSHSALLMLILSMFIFGTIGILRRSIPLSSGIIAFVRAFVGTLFLLGLVRLRGKRLFAGIRASTALWLAVSGALIGFNWILLFEAYNYTTVSTATLCYYMAPVFVILASAILLGEKLTLKRLLCCAAAFAGMIFVSGFFEQGLTGSSQIRGILYGLAASVLYCSVTLLNKKIRGVDPYDKTLIQLGSAAVTMIPYLLLTEDFSQITLSGQSIALLLTAGILHTGICYALYFSSMDGLRAQTIALFSYIDPVTALLLSALLLGEHLSLFGIFGAVMILGAALISET